MVGVFNRTCLITYDAYRNVFPLWALAEFDASRRARQGPVASTHTASNSAPHNAAMRAASSVSGTSVGRW